MTNCRAIVIGSAFGLIAASVVIILLWYGVSGILVWCQIDFMYVLWPVSEILPGDWHRTIPRLIMTALLVMINCLTYSAFALLLRAFTRMIVKLHCKVGGPR
jgi:hypothetical protein